MRFSLLFFETFLLNWFLSLAQEGLSNILSVVAEQKKDTQLQAVSEAGIGGEKQPRKTTYPPGNYPP